MQKEKTITDMNSTFTSLLQMLGKDDLNEILFNWNESELNEDCSEIVVFVDSRAYGPRTGGANKVEKSEFIEWLLSDAPFDPKVYGEKIREDNQWTELVGKARQTIKVSTNG